MNTVLVEVTGPGTTISGVVMAIQKALEAFDADVTVQDEFLGDLDPLRMIELQVKNRPVCIVAKHMPWGG